MPSLWKNPVHRGWILAAFATLALVLSGFPAFSNWQFTRWGMTLDALLHEGKGAIVALDREELAGEPLSQLGVATAKGSFEVDTLQFAATYHFRAGELAAVQLRPEPASFDGVLQSLIRRHGSWISSSSRRSRGACREFQMDWRDSAAGNLVNYFEHQCPTSARIMVVTYTAIENPGQPLRGTD